MLWSDKEILDIAQEVISSYTIQHGDAIICKLRNARSRYEARIRELEAEKKALKNYIETLEAFLSPEELFDAAN